MRLWNQGGKDLRRWLFFGFLTLLLLSAYVGSYCYLRNRTVRVEARTEKLEPLPTGHYFIIVFDIGLSTSGERSRGVTILGA